MENSKRARRKQAAKFPLHLHKHSRRWTKFIRGQHHYFGYADDDPKGEAALAKYLAIKEDLEAGRSPNSVDPKSVSVADLCNAFLRTKKALVGSGDLSQRTFDDYLKACKFLTGSLGRRRAVVDLRPTDFDKMRAKLAERMSHSSVGHEINRIRIVFNYGVKTEIIERLPRFGDSFRRPKAKLIRLERAERGSMMIEADTIRRAIRQANPKMVAMILLGINAGLGNADVGRLRWKNVDLVGGWLDFPRPKTGVGRRAKLWSHTLVALGLLRVMLGPTEQRPEALVFTTSRGGSFAKAKADNPVAKEFRKVLLVIGQHRTGVGFYGLRRAFETIAGESRDQVAVDYVMGHAPKSDDMGAVYRQRISDDRLVAVAETVRAWLFRAQPPATNAPRPNL
jgi:integrase